MRPLWWMKESLLAPEDEGAGGGGGGDNKDIKKDPPPDPKAAKETEAAVALYRALQDPDISKDVIESLARKAGLLNRDEKPPKGGDNDDKPKESKVAKKLRQKLGKDYDKFADSIGPAFDELLEELKEELRSESTRESGKDKWATQVDKFIESHEMTEEIETEMQAIMRESPPNTKDENFDAQRYLRRMYKLACDELDVEPKSKKAGKARRNSREADDELPEVVIKDAPKGASIDDAVEAAINGIRFKRRS